ncbi:hypothetical protein [Microlunatus ginsengisoli]|uniref:Restriction endonuclease n=1 Tax=Microlunatus ginsengisoli TaxID=363863 RepID=A0ABP7ALP9_9ACTN
MSLAEIDRSAVLDAMAEFDRLGRHQFLETYGYGPAREYFVVEGGRSYDSKALLGVAHGYVDGQEALRPSEFSGGDRTVGAQLTRLGFRVVRDPDSQASPKDSSGWDLNVGEQIRRVDLHAQYGGSRQDGVSPSARTPNVLIFTDPQSGEQHGYFDSWREDGFFYYTGRGQRGNQTFTSGNLAILNYQQDGRALRLFEGARGIVTYAGRFELAEDQAWVEEIAPETGGGPKRRVIVFRLSPVLESDPAPTKAGGRTEVGRPFRRRDDEKSPAPAQPRSTDPDVVGRGLNAHRRLENLLAESASASGFQPLDPSVDDPAFDVAWTQGARMTVCEVKSITDGNQTGQLRLGLGQVLDYAHTLRRRGSQVHPVLFIERAPAGDHWSTLCKELGVVLAWPESLADVWR